MSVKIRAYVILSTRFATFNVNQLTPSMLDKGVLIFLGLETWDPDSSAWFAIDILDQAPDIASKVFFWFKNFVLLIHVLHVLVAPW